MMFFLSDLHGRSRQFFLFIMGLTSFVVILIAIEVGLQEINLPNEVKFDELRLLEPERFLDAKISRFYYGLEASEDQLSAFEKCLRVRKLSAETICLSILQNLLRDNPSDGRLWLEVARLRSVSVEGLDDDALDALRRSYEYARREGWIRQVRTNFVVSVWKGLTPELQTTASADILEALQDYHFVVYLCNIYRTNPIVRVAIREVIERAPDEIQRNFVRQLLH